MIMKIILMSLCCMLSTVNIFSQDTNLEKLMAQDWANLKKYHDENEKIKKSSSDVPVVFMGNSITESWVKMSPRFFSKNNYIGRGISGQTTPQMLIRFTPDVIDLQPKVVVILAGTNDIAGNTGYSSVKMITDNIKAMAQLASANNIQVVLSSVLPVYDYPWRKGLEPVEKIKKINEWLKQYAREKNHVYLDYHSHMVDERQGLNSELSGDGVHPNEQGYDIMETLAKKAIEEALTKAP